MAQGGRLVYDPFGWAFFVRMIFSALVDADRLETERWYAEKTNEPVERGWHGHTSDLKLALDAHLAGLTPDDTPINHLRAEVLADARHRRYAEPRAVHSDRTHRRWQDAVLAGICLGSRSQERT